MEQPNSNPHPSAPGDPAARRTAAHWLARRHSGDWQASDAAALERWLAERAEHATAYQDACTAWEAMSALEPLALPRHVAARRPPLRRAWRGVWSGVLAGGVAAMLVAAAGLHWWRGDELVVLSAHGEQRAITLADGSLLRLNADSRAVVRIGGGMRAVLLERGEAAFNIAADRRPFEVEAGGGLIRDIGTRFNVHVGVNEVVVSVSEGRVGVSTALASEVEIGAGESARYDAAGRIGPVGVADIEAVEAWQSGQIVFRDLPLRQALAQLQRYHAIEFELADASVAQLRVSGRFGIGNPQLFLATLQAAFPVRAEVLSARHVRLTMR